MRRAELFMAVFLAVFSCYLMWKSAELPVTWVLGEGPGGGAFPFWLSLGMLLSSIWIIVRWVRGTSPQSRSDEPYFDRQTLMLFLPVVGALTAMIGLIHFIGVYGAVPLFFVFYMRFLGRHTWKKTASFALITPVVTFLFFEIVLNITLPKGYTDPLFYPLFELLL